MIRWVALELPPPWPKATSERGSDHDISCSGSSRGGKFAWEGELFLQRAGICVEGSSSQASPVSQGKGLLSECSRLSHGSAAKSGRNHPLEARWEASQLAVGPQLLNPNASRFAEASL